MLTGLETGLGLEVVVWLQAHGSPVLDALAQAIHVLGAPATYLLLLLPLLLRGYRTLTPDPSPSRRGEQRPAPFHHNHEFLYQWVFTLVAAILFTDVLKLLVQAPRPYQVAPELVRLLVDQRSNYGLPSGHVAGALAMSGLAAVWGGRRWTWILVAAYTLLVAWARMYAGVHYPQDVIVGALVGILSLWISLRYFERFMVSWLWTRWPLRVALVAAGLVLVVNVPGI